MSDREWWLFFSVLSLIAAWFGGAEGGTWMLVVGIFHHLVFGNDGP